MFNNVDAIIAALKQSLAECKKFEDSAEYIFELNQVLNRYKTNLFKYVTDNVLYDQDPKEFFQFRIATSWRIGRGFNGTPRFLDHSPVMLYVNGIVPSVTKRNKEVSFHRAVIIDDVIDIQRIRSIKEDYYLEVSTNKDNLSEREVIEYSNPKAFTNLSMYFNSDRVADDLILFNFQLNAMVYPEASKKYESKRVAVYVVESINRNRKKIIEPVVEQVEHPPSIPTTAKVENFFSPAAVDDTANRLERIRDAVATKRRENASVTRKRHNYW